MQIILFLIFGFVIGLIARAILPGRQHMGIIMTTVIGCVGSLVGGFLGALISGERVLDVHPAGIIGSIVGALIVLGVFTAFRGRSSLRGGSPMTR